MGNTRCHICSCGSCQQCNPQPLAILQQKYSQQPEARQILTMGSAQRNKIQRNLENNQIWLNPDDKNIILQTYPSPVFYAGEVQNLKANGRGRLIIRDYQYVYNGDFDDNMASGNGQFFNKSRSVTFNGNWEQGFPTTGILTNIQNNKRYQYQINRFQDENGNQIRNKYMKRVEMIIKPDGIQYKGTVHIQNFNQRYFVINGQGKMYFPEGSKYKGNFKNGVFHGEGHYIWPQRRAHYVGSFQNGMRHGKGKYYFQHENQTILFEGQWQNGKPSQNANIKTNLSGMSESSS